jgi:hypothetical protein
MDEATRILTAATFPFFGFAARNGGVPGTARVGTRE